jgi:hypothetical protein
VVRTVRVKLNIPGANCWLCAIGKVGLPAVVFSLIAVTHFNLIDGWVVLQHPALFWALSIKSSILVRF